VCLCISVVDPSDAKNYKGLITIKSVVRALINQFAKVVGVEGKSLEEKEKAFNSFQYTDEHIATITSEFDKMLVNDNIDVQFEPLQEGCTVLQVVQALRTHYRVPVVTRMAT